MSFCVVQKLIHILPQSWELRSGPLRQYGRDARVELKVCNFRMIKRGEDCRHYIPLLLSTPCLRPLLLADDSDILRQDTLGRKNGCSSTWKRRGESKRLSEIKNDACKSRHGPWTTNIVEGRIMIDIKLRSRRHKPKCNPYQLVACINSWNENGQWRFVLQ